MKYLFFICFISTLFCFSCNRSEKIKAKIFERTKMREQTLKIKFRYFYDSKEYVDSSIIENNVIENDSIEVLVKKSHPEKAILPF